MERMDREMDAAAAGGGAAGCGFGHQEDERAMEAEVRYKCALCTE